jgi:hypothetical protein
VAGVPEGPPALPSYLPADLRAFVECRADRVELEGGAAPWIPVPPVLKKTVGLFLKPKAQIEPQTGTPGAARVGVRWALVSMTFVASVVDGRLVLDPDGLRGGMLDDVAKGMDDWANQLNDWLAANGYRLGSPDIAPGRIALRKERLA